MKINVTAINKLNGALIAVQGPRISARTIDVEDIQDAVEQIESQLSHMLLKKDWRGLRFSVDMNAQDFPNSYKGTPESTIFTLERGASGWFVTRICRGICGPHRIIPINIMERAAELAEFASSPRNW